MEGAEDCAVDSEAIFKPLTTSNTYNGTEANLKSPDNKLANGKVIPTSLRERFLQEGKAGTPLEDIDPYYHDKQTFVVLDRWGRIYRYSDNANNFMFATLGPNDLLRKFAIYLETHWLFSAFIIATVLINIAALVADKITDEWIVRLSMAIINYVCLSVYCIEFGLKLVARGFTGEFPCLRDPWIWLDAAVIVTGIYLYSWIRVFKVIPLVPKIQESFWQSLRAVKSLCVLLPPIVFLVWFFTLVATQLYMGTLWQKCLKRIDNSTTYSWDWEKNFDWYRHPGDNFTLCGNYSGASKCPTDYVCLQGFFKSGDDYLDSVRIATLPVVRIASQDFTDEIYRQILSANGTWHILFFVAMFCIFTFPVGCTFYAILGHFFSEEDTRERQQDKEDTNDMASSNDHHVREPGPGCFAKLKSLVNPEWLRNLVIFAMLVDIFGILFDYGEHQSSVMYYLCHYAIPGMVFVVYAAELVLGQGWNAFDIAILFTLISQAFHLKVGRGLSPIRLLKAAKFWPSLNMIFTVYCKTIRSLCGWILLAIIVIAFFVLTGRTQYRYFSYFDESDDDNDSRWRVTNFWNSFRVILRMLWGEWYETLVINRLYSVWTFYTWVNLCGSLLMGYLLVGVVHTSVGELQKIRKVEDMSRRNACRRLVKLVIMPFQILFKTQHLDNFPIAPDNEHHAVRNDDDTPLGGNILRSFTDHRIYKCICVVFIAAASVALMLEPGQDSSEYFKLGLFIVDAVFTIGFLLAIILEMIARGCKDSIVSRPGILFDALIILESVFSLGFYQLSVSTGEYRVGMFWLRSFRPLMLISRVDFLKSAFKGICTTLKGTTETILAIFFIWLIFDVFAVHWLAGLFYKCVELNTHKEMFLDKINCSAQNYSWENSDLNFDNPVDGFISTVLLVARTGWVSIINDATDAVGMDMARKKDHSKLWFIYFAVFMLIGGLGALGVLFSHIFQKFKEDNGCQIILTESQALKYTEAKTPSGESYWLRLENEYIPCPENSSCRQRIYKFATNRYFDWVIMVIIIADLIVLSLDFDRAYTNETYDTLMYCWNFIVIIYVAEMIIKLIACGGHYFRSGWNILDMVIILLGMAGLIFINSIGEYVIVLRLLRILRLARILRFLLAKEWGLYAAKKFVSAFSRAKYALGNLLLLQVLFMMTFAILGTYLFDNVKIGVGVLGDQINFRTFWASLRTLTLLVVGGLPALDGLYLGLGNEKNCEEAVCGNTIAAVVYIGMYAGLTFCILLNMYAVMITEIMWEFGRGKFPAVIEKIESDDVVENENVSENCNFEHED